MPTKKGKVTKNSKNKTVKKDNENFLGFLPEYIEDASVGDDTPSNKKYIYKKLKDPLVVESNNQKRSIDVYLSSAETDDLNQLLNYLLPKNKV